MARRSHQWRRQCSFVLMTTALVVVSLWSMSDNADADELSPAASWRRLEGDPKNAMTMDQKRKGGVLLHCLGLFYMFVAIAIVCDECFVPSLEVITEVLHLSPDVAGATFMAAGGSAPEFFTSLIGAVVVESDIGTGTIIGSAVFNVLFVIGACAAVAPEPLQLTWFPLARDSCFYAVDLVVVTIALHDGKVHWYESLILFLLYIAYTCFMAHSQNVEEWANNPKLAEGEEDQRWAESRLPPSAEAPQLVCSEDATNGAAGTGEVGTLAVPVRQPRSSSIHSQGSVISASRPFRHKSLRLSGSVSLSSVKNLVPQDVDEDTRTGSTGGTGACVDVMVDTSNEGRRSSTDSSLSIIPTPQADCKTKHVPEATGSKTSAAAGTGDEATGVPQQAAAADEEEENHPLNLMPPEADAGVKEWLAYVLTLPIVALLVVTVPDVRREGFRKLFVLTFVVSILWIALFTSVMVWFTQVIAETMGVPDHILAITVLAAGTSVPDLLTSMIVARQGHGDMAVSSSIGSNIFDVTVGLPVPWILFAAYRNKPVAIRNEGLELSVLMLLAMLGLTIGTIMLYGWRMTRSMGTSMMLLYFMFQGAQIGMTFVPEEDLKLF